MRQQFVKTVTRLMGEDESIVLILGDISVHAFKECFERWPDRCFNVGVCEQSMVGLAAGMAKCGKYPIVHTIAAFLVRRAYEQIFIDFGYQQLHGMFVSVGASYDYAELGPTHFAPDDCALMRQIPGMAVHVPFTKSTLNAAMGGCVGQRNLSYIRLAEDSFDDFTWPHDMGTGTRIVAVGPMVRFGFPVAVANNIDMDVVTWPTHLNLRPLETVDRILLLEPYHEGGLVQDILKMFYPRKVLIDCMGVPYTFLNTYGTRQQIDEAIGFTEDNVRNHLEMLLNV